jgi:hypothetical protein
LVDCCDFDDGKHDDTQRPESGLELLGCHALSVEYLRGKSNMQGITDQAEEIIGLLKKILEVLGQIRNAGMGHELASVQSTTAHTPSDPSAPQT